MYIKKFIADNVSEAMNMVKMELGEDAVILHTKKISSKGFLGVFSKKDKVEILAALDQNKQKEKPKKLPTQSLKKELATKDSISGSFDAMLEPDNDFRELFKNESVQLENLKPTVYNKPLINRQIDNKVKEDEIKEKYEIKADIKDLKSNYENNFQEERRKLEIEEKKNYDRLENEIFEIKKLLSNFNKKIDTINTTEKNLSKNIREYMKYLKKKGLTQETINQMVSEIMQYDDFDDKKMKESVFNYLVDEFKEKGRDSDFHFDKRINIFVGPTGVGKTTTLAKLASNAILKENKKVGFLTLDTYRIAAIEQLKIYAEILGVPIEVAYDYSDLKSSMDRLKDKDLIFVDTAGRSHRNYNQMDELKSIIDSFDEKNVFVLVSANYHLDDVERIVREYDFLDEFKIIVTKLDETSRKGIVLEILNKFDRKVSHLTFGQNVPDDLDQIRIENLVNEILKE